MAQTSAARRLTSNVFGCASCFFMLTLLPAILAMVWSVQFDKHTFARYDYSGYSLPDPLEPNECMINCASPCGTPALRTMATGCVKVQVGCECSSGQGGTTCTGCRYECSSQPGWMTYSADQLAEKSCAESIEHCASTCSCSGSLHRSATIALSMHFWVSAWTIFPVACFLICCLPAWCLYFVCVPPCCKSKPTNLDRGVTSHDNIKRVQQRLTIPKICNIDNVSVCWIIVTAIANVSDVVLGWVVMNDIENSSDSHSIGQTCGHEYMDATRLESSNIVATIRACPCILALLCIVAASSNLAFRQQRSFPPGFEAHPGKMETKAKEPQNAWGGISNV